MTLTGADWQPGEAVTIVVKDTDTASWSLTRTVTADATGAVTLVFTLPARYVPNYDVAATGELSGAATTAFTDAATGNYQYWVSSVSPASNSTVTGGTQITYTLNARSNQCQTWLCGSYISVQGATATVTLTGDATFTNVPNSVTVSGDGKTATWTITGSLTRAGTSVMLTATVGPGTSGGQLTATAGDGGDSLGSFRSGGGRLRLTTHDVLAPTVGNCHFADPESGEYAQSICWFDLGGYVPAQAASATGQPMRQELPNGYVLSYTITTTGSGGAGSTNVIAEDLPTWGGAFLGNTSTGLNNTYTGIDGYPALYQQTDGRTTVLNLTDIVLRDQSGQIVTGFALVGADAESTDSGESIRWVSDQPFTSIGALGNSCGGALQWASTTDVRCNGVGGVGAKSGTAILYAQDPTQFSQTLVGGGLQGVAFGVMVSGVQLTKQVVNPVFANDAFAITATYGGNTLSTVTTDDSGFADTGQLHLIASGGDQTVVLSEAPTAGTDAANYATTWSCTRNNESYDPGAGDTSKQVTVTFGDFVSCEITNTGPSLTLAKTTDNTAGGALAPGDWSLSATNSAGTAVINEAPSVPVSQTDTVTTAATVTRALPRGFYALDELSAVTGSDAYAAGLWSCLSGAQSVPAPAGVVSVTAGAQVTCGITNTHVPPATVAMSKVLLDVVGDVVADASGWTLGAALAPGGSAGVTILPAGTQTTSADGTVPQPWTVTFPVPGSTATVTVSEQAQAGYSFVEGTCTVTPASGAPRTVAISDPAGTPITGLQPGDQVSCVITNQQQAGSVTWSKIADDAAETLLAGSEWTLAGPGVPDDTVVTDCAESTCAEGAFLDQNPDAGQFLLTDLAWGTYTLTESKAPVGYVISPEGPIEFTISAMSLTADLEPIVNDQQTVPDLPFTGGLSTDLFVALGAGLLAAAAIGALVVRRRSASLSQR